jgi:hypothetical protein
MHDRVNRLQASGVGHPGAALRILQQESCSDACILVRAAVAALRFHEPCERHRLRTYTKLGELLRVTSPHLTSPHLDTGAIETELELCVYPDHAPVGQGQLLRSMHACMHWRSSFFR